MRITGVTFLNLSSCELLVSFSSLFTCAGRKSLPAYRPADFDHRNGGQMPTPPDFFAPFASFELNYFSGAQRSATIFTSFGFSDALKFTSKAPSEEVCRAFPFSFLVFTHAGSVFPFFSVLDLRPFGSPFHLTGVLIQPSRSLTIVNFHRTPISQLRVKSGSTWSSDLVEGNALVRTVSPTLDSSALAFFSLRAWGATCPSNVLIRTPCTLYSFSLCNYFGPIPNVGWDISCPCVGGRSFLRLL